jgi:PAS domain S-box-containing protein
VRLLDPKSLALASLQARGRLRPGARERVALSAAAVRKTHLARKQLEAKGIAVAESDEPLFEGSERAIAVPLAVAGSLFGVVNLEYAHGAPGDPEGDGALLFQLANQAALGVRNLRSIEELTFLKTYLEELIENANALIVVLDRSRHIQVFNRTLTRLTGWPREEAMGKDLLGFFPEIERERMERVLLRSLEGEPVTSFETRILLKRGGEAQVAVNTAPIAGPGGVVEGVIAIGQDLTALRALEVRAEHYQKLASFGRLAAGIVHELNNPLTAVVTYSEALLQKYPLGGLEDADREKLRRIKEAGERIARFSGNLITYARPSADKVERIDVAALLEQAAGMCEPVLREASARLVRRLKAVPGISGIRGSLLQVFVNLLTNAAQAMPAGGGTITLDLSSAGETVVAQVKDDGGGMPPEVRSRIFEPFFTTKAEGSGLGLPIVQGIVARHGGTITVDSIAGEGTTFTVVLPRNPPVA